MFSNAGVVKSAVVALAVALGVAGTGCAANARGGDGANAEDTGSTADALKVKVDYNGNCDKRGTVAENDCAARHAGAVIHDGSQTYTFQELDRFQTATLVNTGTVAYVVRIEQGFAWTDGVLVQPGQSMRIAAIDHLSLNYAILVMPDFMSGGSALFPDTAKAHITVDGIPPEPPPQSCGDECTSTFNGCKQGCSEIPNAGPACLASCTLAAQMCLDRCK